MTLTPTAIFELSRCFARHRMAMGRGGKVINIASFQV
jgi:hypothetical protein